MTSGEGGEAGPVRRGLSFPALLALGLNGIVGVGIFFAGKEVAQGAPGHAGTWLFLVTAALLAPVGLAFSVLVRRFPEDGGPIAFAREAFGETAAFAVGWIAFVSAVTSTAAIVSGLVEANLDPSARGLVVGVELAALVAFAGVAALGLAPSAHAWTALTVAKLVPLVVLLAAAAFFGGRAEAPAAQAATSPKGLFAAALVTVFAYQGFEIVPLVAGRADDAKTKVPRAVLGSLALAAVLYAALHAASVRALPALATSTAPLVEAAGVYGGPGLAKALRIGTNVSAVGIAFGMVVMTPRYLAALGLPVLSRESAREVPLPALGVTVALTGVLFLLGSRRELFALSSVAVLAQYGTTSAALVALARRGAHGLGGAHLALGALALVVSVGLAATGATLREAGLAAGLVVVGLVVRALARSGGR